MPCRVRVLALSALLVLSAGCSPDPRTPGPSTADQAPPRLAAELTQDSRDTARDRVAVVIANEGPGEVVPESIEYVDPRLTEPLAGDRLRAVPPGAERRFPLPLVDPVCGGPARGPGTAPSTVPGELLVRVGTAEVRVAVRDDVGVVARWVERRCAELEVAAVAELSFTEVRPREDDGSVASVDLLLTATPTGEGSGAYVIESVAGTPVFTSAGEPWTPGVPVRADGEPVEVALSARPARCDGHVFGESAGATSFLVGVRLDGERREVLVRMAPEVAGQALDAAVEICGSGR